MLGKIDRARTLTLLGLLFGVVAAGALAGTALAAGDTEILIEPSNQNVVEGENVTYEVVIDNASNGVQLYDITVTVGNTTAATIIDGNDKLDGTAKTNISADNSSIQIATVGGTSADSGKVSIANVTVHGNNTGAAALTVTERGIGDNNSDQYTVTATQPATVVVEAEPEAPDVTGNGSAATDPDGDDLFEDIDGDGTFDVFDVQDFLDNFSNSAVQNNAALFNFNGQDGVDIFDVQALLDEL